MSEDINYDKYLKYKTKYLKLKYDILQQGGAHSCAPCRTNANFPVENATIVIYTDKLPKLHTKHVFLVRSLGGKWMTPGGQVDSTDASCWDAMKREFKEEIGQDFSSIFLPNTITKSYDAQYPNRTGGGSCTRIYYRDIGRYHGNIKYTTLPINRTGGPGFNETIGCAWINLQDIIQGNVSDVKPYVARSLKTLSLMGLI